VASAWTRFKQAGLVTKTEDNTECCYALQDKVWIEDPDGNAWEVFVVKGEAAGMGQGPLMDKEAGGTGCCVPKISASAEPGVDASIQEATPKASGRCC
jgi:hypothetical protein